MIEAEELSFRDWECSEYMTHQQEENRISLPNLDQHSRGNSTLEENRYLVFHLGLGVRIRICMLEMVNAENLDFFCLMFETYCTARKCRRKH